MPQKGPKSITSNMFKYISTQLQCRVFHTSTNHIRDQRLEQFSYRTFKGYAEDMFQKMPCTTAIRERIDALNPNLIKNIDDANVR